MNTLDEIEARIRDCKTYKFGMRNADKLAHEDAPALLALVLEQQAQIATAKSDALREAAEHFKTRSDTYHKTMQEMADSREYGVEDIVRYGAYSAEANTTATWLRTRAALTATAEP